MGGMDVKKPRSCGAGIFLGAKRIADQRDDGGKEPLEEDDHRQDERPDVVDEQQEEIPREKKKENGADKIQKNRQHRFHRLSRPI